MASEPFLMEMDGPLAGYAPCVPDMRRAFDRTRREGITASLVERTLVELGQKRASQPTSTSAT